ncbi:hypothetical protein BJ085DRAFT_39064 [Dimargaris cristalligena]|uniref:Uncharacterized protein n=1 Tax=Dimargaris cristalligena TaxID=215637 RepID=A0A4Q0A0Z4_9FUNG|nr:hypothetical protein BJ085DRAFT_39064 [Dimargaris cristalligena]|eukprot:RKP39687.1 hypothetical protein BJ085DRAFT_39064 [Dimargaris cristalligena]
MSSGYSGSSGHTISTLDLADTLPQTQGSSAVSTTYSSPSKTKPNGLGLRLPQLDIIKSSRTTSSQNCQGSDSHVPHRSVNDPNGSAVALPWVLDTPLSPLDPCVGGAIYIDDTCPWDCSRGTLDPCPSNGNGSAIGNSSSNIHPSSMDHFLSYSRDMAEISEILHDTSRYSHYSIFGNETSMEWCRPSIGTAAPSGAEKGTSTARNNPVERGASATDCTKRPFSWTSPDPDGRRQSARGPGEETGGENGNRHSVGWEKLMKQLSTHDYHNPDWSERWGPPPPPCTHRLNRRGSTRRSHMPDAISRCCPPTPGPRSPTTSAAAAGLGHLPAPRAPLLLRGLKREVTFASAIRALKTANRPPFARLLLPHSAKQFESVLTAGFRISP